MKGASWVDGGSFMDTQVVREFDELSFDEGVQLEAAVAAYARQFEEKQEAFLEQNGKTAQSVLELCRVVHAASCQLSDYPEKLKDFRKRTKLTKNSTFSQHMTIGKNYDTLSPHAPKLPASWYALYRIARLDDDVLEKALADGKIHPSVTQGQLNALAGRVSKKRVELRFLAIFAPDDASSDVLFQIQEQVFQLLKSYEGKGFSACGSKKWRQATRLHETLKVAA